MSVTRLSAEALRNSPVRTLAEALRYTPGIAFVDFDGLGHDSQLMLRGFYGGGEAEYAVLLIDGRPVNSPESGRITWDLLPLSAIESIEIVRGGTSAAWGDAALGGVINVRTRPASARGINGAISAGSHGTLQGSLATSAELGSRRLALHGNIFRTDGFRDHAERSSGGFGATLGLLESGRGALSLTTLNDWREFDEPGPLSNVEIVERRDQSSPFFRFDHASERTNRLGIEARRALGARSELAGSVNGELRRSDRVRTLVLSPEFADTRNRVLNAARLQAAVQSQLGSLLAGASDNLVMGIEGSVAGIRSRYYDFLMGTAGDYAEASASRGPLSERGVGERTALAGYMSYGVDATSRIRISAGGRFDWLQDTFEARAPSDPSRHTATHSAVSPRFGVNWRYADAAGNSGNLFANVSRSFKAPTQDQLFDQRAIPVPFPPFEVTFANESLDPQYGTSYELGAYHAAVLARDVLRVDLALAAYQIDLRDELDFDVQSLSYQNIGRSRHRGMESSITLHGPGSVSAFANYTLQSAIARSGENEGRQLKAIPRHFVVAGVTASEQALSASVTFTSAQKIYLDDANTRDLSNWSRWDLRVAYAIDGIYLFVDALNAFDERYSTTGFPDPGGSNITYFHPAARRTMRAGVSRNW